MNPIINISFIASTVAELSQALDMIKAAGVAPTVSVIPPAAVPVPISGKGPYETEYLRRTGTTKMKMTESVIAQHGNDREAEAKRRLDALGDESTIALADSAPCSEYVAPDEKGETYTPAAIPDAEDMDASDY